MLPSFPFSPPRKCRKILRKKEKMYLFFLCNVIFQRPRTRNIIFSLIWLIIHTFSHFSWQTSRETCFFFFFFRPFKFLVNFYFPAEVKPQFSFLLFSFLKNTCSDISLHFLFLTAIMTLLKFFCWDFEKSITIIWWCSLWFTSPKACRMGLGIWKKEKKCKIESIKGWHTFPFVIFSRWSPALS